MCKTGSFRRCYVNTVCCVDICRSNNYYKVSIGVCGLSIQSCSQVQFLLCKVLFNIIVLNQRLPVVDHLDLLRNDIHSGHMMMLGKQCGNLQTNITSTRNGDFVILHVIYSSGPHRAYPLIFAPTYISCISGWYFIFIISCVISHSSIKITSNTLPNSKAGTFFAVPTPSSGTHTTGGIQPDGVYH